MAHKIYKIVIILFFVGCFRLDASAQTLSTDSLEGLKGVIPNIAMVEPGLIRGALPGDEGLQKLKQAGVCTIVCLNSKKSLVNHERKTAMALGMNFINIPLGILREPSDKAIKLFLNAVSHHNEQPVYVHCLHGQDRTGTMIGIFRIDNNGWSGDQAYKEMLQAGFRPYLSKLSEAVFEEAKLKGLPGHVPSLIFIAHDLMHRIIHEI